MCIDQYTRIESLHELTRSVDTGYARRMEGSNVTPGNDNKLEKVREHRVVKDAS